MNTNWFIEKLNVDYARFESACRRVCRKVVGADADDVAQATAAAVLAAHAKEPNRFTHDEAVLAYVTRVAKNTAYEQVRKARRAQGVGAGVEIEQFGGDAESNDRFEAKLLERLTSCEQAAALLESVSERVRDVFLRMCRKLTARSRDETRQDVAKALGVSESTVRRDWLTALELLRIELESGKYE